MIKTHTIRLIIISLFLALIVIASCKRERNPTPTKTPVPEKVPKISKVTFYLENSESMFGYVNGTTNYIDVITELAEKPEFASENTLREFNFINGGENIKITPIGNTPSSLRNNLNLEGFDVGDKTKSNLNGMFQIALEKAVGDSISVLISDGLYDVGRLPDPVSAIRIAGRETRTKFIQRLDLGNVQTILIKLNSNFNGNYFYTSRSGLVRLNQQRPFYIWIFGESRLLNKYFPENYLNELAGYESMVRFLKLNKIKIPYEVVSVNPLGRFKFDHKTKNKLVDASPVGKEIFNFK